MSSYSQRTQSKEQVEQGALDVFLMLGILSYAALANLGRTDLVKAIKKYPGGMPTLKRKLGVHAKWLAARLLDEYWTDVILTLPLEKRQAIMDCYLPHIRENPGISITYLEFATAFLQAERLQEYKSSYK